MGTSVAWIGITLVSKDSYVGVEIYIPEKKSLYDKLYAQKEEIEKKLGFAMNWMRLDSAKASRILYKIPGLNFDDHSNYDALINDTIDKVVKIRDTFKNYLK